MQRTYRQKGFTMVELIVVIMILGILAAVALPRFVNMQGDARIAKLNAGRGSVAAASALIHGAAVARQTQTQPTCAATGTVPYVNSSGVGNVCTEEGAVTVLNLYPSGDQNGIGNAAGIKSTEGYTLSVAAGPPAVVTFSVNGATTSANCSFTYTEPTAIGAAPVISAVTTTGC